MAKTTKNYAELTPAEIKDIRDALDSFIAVTSDQFDACAEAVAAVAFYRLQRHPTWGRNATDAQKSVSYKHWKGVCHRCHKHVERGEAKFHHLTRGVPNQHVPSNLVPEHTSCHDDEHNVLYGSFDKGSPVSKKRKKTKIDNA